MAQKELVVSEMGIPRRRGWCGKCLPPCGLEKHKLKEVFTRRVLKTVLMGQFLSLLICGTAVCCQCLANAEVETPMFQSFINYALLLLVYTRVLCTRKGDHSLIHVLKTNWTKYLLMSLCDVEANYTVVKAYQFTTLTSIQLLDCFVIPVLMFLSWFFLKTRYRMVHFSAVVVCLLGVGAMVGADIQAGRDQGSADAVLLGDGLVLLSAALYAVSNVCQEDTVKRLSPVQFLGMMGLFGTVFSGVQLAVLELSAVASVQWDVNIILLFALYALCMFALYSLMPLVVKWSSATAVNLSLLTADLFSLFCGVFLFHYRFSSLYIVSFVLIIVGFAMFNVVPTTSAMSEEEEPHRPQGGEEEPLRPRGEEEEPLRPQSEEEEPLRPQGEEPLRPRGEEEEPLRPQSEEEEPLRPQGEEPLRPRGEEEESPRPESEEEEPLRPQSEEEEPLRPQGEGEGPLRPQSEEEELPRPESKEEEPLRPQSEEEEPLRLQVEEVEPLRLKGGATCRLLFPDEGVAVASL